MPSMTFWRVTLKLFRNIRRLKNTYIASSLLISSWTAASWSGIWTSSLP
jgi:hypothetical protein